MYLVQLLLPLCTSDGRDIPEDVFARIRAQLTERFGGVTAYSRAPAEGRWRDPSGAVAHDEVVIIEVMCDDLERPWWKQLREELTRELGQQELVVRAMPIEAL